MAVNGIVHSPAGVVPLSRSGTPLINHLCPRCAPSIYCIARAVLGSQSHDNAMPCDCASYAAAGEEKSDHVLRKRKMTYSRVDQLVT